MREAGYDRQRAAAYAVRWAMGRNPAYYDFTKIGGDCTNFVSQCLFAGSGIMNFTPVTGWFYRSADDRTASWTGVEYLYRFLLGHCGGGGGRGPACRRRGEILPLPAGAAAGA